MNIIFFIFVLFFSTQTYSSPTAENCSVASIDEALLSMGIDTGKRTNRELKEAVIERYGNPVWDHTVSLAQHLAHDSEGSLDHKTLTWVQEAIWSVDHPHGRFHLFPVNDLNQHVFDDFLEDLVYIVYSKAERIVVSFQTMEQKNKFENILKDNDKLDSYITKSIVNPTPEQIKEQRKKVRQYFSNGRNYQVGFNSTLESPIISISGHGYPGQPYLMFGSQENTVTVSELVENLKTINIPLSATINIDACYSGCLNMNLFIPNQLEDEGLRI